MQSNNLDLGNELRILLADDDEPPHSFSTHFQPIVNVVDGSILGYEALTRGPSNSLLHSPLVLFDVAAHFGLLIELERRLIRLIVRRFISANLPGNLFLNVSADTLTESADRLDLLRGEFREAHLPPTRIVVELTEVRPVNDPEKLMRAIQGLRHLGVIIALDDVGEGFASLKRWAEMRPDFIKIDRHFIDGISRDPVKMEFVRSMLGLASSVGSTVIAEGLESEADLRVLQQIGIQNCQGYLLGKPSPHPRSTLRAEVEQLITSKQKVGLPFAMVPSTRATTAEQLARRNHVVDEKLLCREVVELFREDPELLSLPVLDDEERPIGLLRRATVLTRASDRYFLDLFGKRQCTILMDKEPLRFDAATSLSVMSEVVANLRESYITDGFIVTRHGQYFGTGKVTDLLKAVSDLQLFTARYANPLTQLPGNVPIDRHIDLLLSAEKPFTVAYFDLDNFKPYNDIYGYKKGDEIIQLCARVIQQSLDDHLDFLGHVGGDDFIAVMQSENWEARVQSVLAQFDTEIEKYFDAPHLAARGYVTMDRRGQEVFHPLCSVSAGIAMIDPHEYGTHAEVAMVASEAKRQAKKDPGSSYFVERRRNQRRLLEESVNVEHTRPN
jgi:diguanylate cyclase (GGDEF)-like protein